MKRRRLVEGGRMYMTNGEISSQSGWLQYIPTCSCRPLPAKFPAKLGGTTKK